jgi:transcription elongation factor Elf1
MVLHTCPVCGSRHEVHPVLDRLSYGRQLNCSPKCKARFPALVRARILAEVFANAQQNECNAERSVMATKTYADLQS